MFNRSINERLAEWFKLRNDLEHSDSPLQDVWDFWHVAPFIPYNKKVDAYYIQSWPSPWEIIADNKYDDFTRSLMIAWTLKLTKRFNKSKIEIKTLVDTNNDREYNLVFIDENWIINYNDNGPIESKNLNGSFRLENIVEVNIPR
jgi:hypothetical protein